MKLPSQMAVIFGLLLASILPLTCSRFADSHKGAGNIETIPYISYDITESALAWADSVYSYLTPEQRLAQMLMPAVYSSVDRHTMLQLVEYAANLRVGGLLLLQGEAAQAAALADTLSLIADSIPYLPEFFLAIDAETGLGMRLSDAPTFPWNRNVDSEADESLFFDYGAEIGREASIIGINMILGPVVDVDRPENAGKGIMKKRSLGSDQVRVGNLATAYSRGLESRGVIGVAKHFPGHGPTTTDSHRSLPRIDISKDELLTVDLLPFRMAVNYGIPGIMVGHIWAPSLDSVCRPATFSPIIIEKLLREEMGFEGLVLIDAVGMKGAKGFDGADAVMAGADIILAPPDTRGELERLTKALHDGRLSQSRVEQSCKRILFYKYIYLVAKNVPTSSRIIDPEILKVRLSGEAPFIISTLKGS